MARTPKITKIKLTRSGKPRRSTTGGPVPKNVNMDTWRTRLQASKLKFDDDQKNIFLTAYAQHGRMGQSADLATVSLQTVRNHLDNDPEFAEGFERARQAYRDVVHAVVTKLAIDGLDEPIIGGEFRDQVVAYKKVFATNLVMAEARRVDPGYKDQSTVDLNVAGGVFVAPTTLTPAEWAAQFGKPKPDDAKEG